jgi:hypothetical protein
MLARRRIRVELCRATLTRLQRIEVDLGGQIMVRYFYAWAPLVIVAGTIVLVTIPELALIGLVYVAFMVLVALARAIVSMPRVLSRAVTRRPQDGRSVSYRAAAAAEGINLGARRIRSVAAGATALFATSRSEGEEVT